MKILFVLLICVAVVYGWEGRPCAWNHGDGRPACNAQEMAQGCWRHNWDNTAFWQCDQLGVPARLIRCPVEGLFDVNTLTCINWANWVWTWECNPPSQS